MKDKDEMIIGIVKTNNVNSAVEFEVCSRADWEEMDDAEREFYLMEAAWGSGQVEVFLKSEV